MLISTRRFGMYRVYWAIKDENKDLKGVWSEYYKSVNAWNFELPRHKSLIGRYLGDKAARQLEDMDDGNGAYKGKLPETIHGNFILAHRLLKRYLDCREKACDKGIVVDTERDLLKAMDRLGAFTDRFLVDARQQIYQSAWSRQWDQ